MKISSYLKKEFIIPDLKVNTKKEAIHKLSDLLKSSNEIKDFDKFIKDVFEREELMTTGIGHNIAIPHARTETVENIIMAMGICPAGMDFNSLDDQPVEIIFLIGAPANKVGEYLKALAYLTRILMKKDFREQLKNAKNADEILSIFMHREDK